MKHSLKLSILCLLASMGILFLLLANPACGEERPSRVPRLAYYGALNTADLVSTEAALARGGHEANPLIQSSRSGRIAVKSLTTVGLSEIDRILTRKKRKKAVWGIRIGALALHGFVVYHNHHAAR